MPPNEAEQRFWAMLSFITPYALVMILIAAGAYLVGSS